MSTQSGKPNVHQRLLAVQRAITNIAPDGHNERFHYRYVSNSAVLSAIRAAMNENGLVLVPEVVEHDCRVGAIPVREGAHHLSVIRMRMTWVNVDDPQDTVVCEWSGAGIDGQEKGISKAVTIAVKYFLLKQFLIPTDDADPDGYTGEDTGGQQRAKSGGNGDLANAARRRKSDKAPSSLGEMRALLTTRYDVPATLHLPLLNKLIVEHWQGDTPAPSAEDLPPERWPYVVKAIDAIVADAGGDLGALTAVAEATAGL
ncbi:MAG: ERF family protein [Armatimonadota bacterium]